MGQRSQPPQSDAPRARLCGWRKPPLSDVSGWWEPFGGMHASHGLALRSLLSVDGTGVGVFGKCREGVVAVPSTKIDGCLASRLLSFSPPTPLLSQLLLPSFLHSASLPFLAAWSYTALARVAASRESPGTFTQHAGLGSRCLCAAHEACLLPRLIIIIITPFSPTPCLPLLPLTQA
jgi:hypothetical protein